VTTNSYELNNQLIEEYYMMTKRREFIYLNIGEDESFEDSDEYMEHRRRNDSS
jgi:hypothetical protein